MARWLDRGRMWKARGFQEASEYCLGKVIDVGNDWIKYCSNGESAAKDRVQAMMRTAEEIRLLPNNDEAFVAHMDSFWNGHPTMDKNVQQQEKTDAPLIDGQPNLKKTGVLDRAATPEGKIALEHIKAENARVTEPEESQQGAA